MQKEYDKKQPPNSRLKSRECGGNYSNCSELGGTGFGTVSSG